MSTRPGSLVVNAHDTVNDWMLGRLTLRDAIRRLVALGYTPAEAEGVLVRAKLS